jgi:hypothetical protein
MLTFETPVLLQLEDGEMLRWRQARALELRVLEGRVWVTRQDDPDDHFLGSGETIRLDRSQKVIIGADGPARVRLSAPLARRPRVTAGAWLAQWLAWPLARTG